MLPAVLLERAVFGKEVESDITELLYTGQCSLKGKS